jgi:hypothetical protein
MGDERAQRVLLVGATNGFASACRRVAARLGAELEQCDLSSVAENAAAWPPHVLLMSKAVFASNSIGLEALAERHRAALAAVDADALDIGELEILLEASLAAAEERHRGPREPEGERVRPASERSISVAPSSYRSW